MTEALIVSNIVLWLAVLALLATVYALTRQIGVLYERIAPMGALMIDAGPKVGDVAPALDLVTIDGRPFVTGGARARNLLIFFLSPTCPVCKKLLPILKSTARSEASWLRIVLASDGERGAQEKFYRQAKLEEFPYLLSTELGLAYKVSRLPQAVLIDETGQVKAKGLVNSREQLESLFTAKELGVSSVQEYLKSA